MTLEDAIAWAEKLKANCVWGGEKQSELCWYVFKWNNEYIIYTKAEVEKHNLTGWKYKTK